jgi:hypothetical protein
MHICPGAAIGVPMTTLLQQAFEAASRLPDPEQDRIGRELKAYLEKLERLRADVDEGIRSLDAGEGRELDIEEIVERANARDARR